MHSASIRTAVFVSTTVLLLASCSKGGSDKPKTVKPVTTSESTGTAKVTPAPKEVASSPKRTLPTAKKDPSDPPYNNGVTQPGER